MEGEKFDDNNIQDLKNRRYGHDEYYSDQKYNTIGHSPESKEDYNDLRESLLNDKEALDEHLTDEDHNDLLYQSLTKFRYYTDLDKGELESIIKEWEKDKVQTLKNCPSDRKLENQDFFNRQISYLNNVAKNYDILKEAKNFLQFLLEHKVNINARDVRGQTCLHRFCKDVPEMAKAIEFLVSNNADINIKDKWGRTPLDVAIFDNHSLMRFRERGYYHDDWTLNQLVASYSGRIEICDFLIRNGAVIGDEKNKDNFEETKKLIAQYKKYLKEREESIKEFELHRKESEERRLKRNNLKTGKEKIMESEKESGLSKEQGEKEGRKNLRAEFAYQQGIGSDENTLDYWILEKDDNWHDSVRGDGHSYRPAGIESLTQNEGESEEEFKKRVEQVFEQNKGENK